jgi:type IV pilus assembly protein PilQ
MPERRERRDRPCGFARHALWLCVLAVASVGASAAAQPDFTQLAEQMFRAQPGSSIGPGDVQAGGPATGDGQAASGDTDFATLRTAITVSEHELVEVHVADESLAAVLQVLSVQSQRNIVAGSGIDERVTADLYGVTFYEALDALLHVNGYGYIERDGFIYVYTQDQLSQMRTAAQRRVSRVIELDYLNAIDAAQLVAPLLSEDGTITTPGASPEFSIPSDTPTGKDDYTGASLLVVNDYPDRADAIESLVARLDTKPAQVLVEATILQTALTEANAFGIDFSLIADLDFDSFLSPLDAVDGLIGGRGTRIIGGGEVPIGVPDDGTGRAISSSVGNVAGPATLKAGIIDQDVGVFLRVLDEVTDITVVSNPKLLTLNRQPARVLVGTRVGFLNTTTTETSTTQSVEFLDTGTQLHVRPFVTRDNLIRLELKPQVSTFRPRATVTATGQTVTIPDEDTTELVTNLIVRDGQTVVLGGLFTETTTATRRQVPVLGDVPIIGAAFRGHDDSTNRSEIIFLVTPSIVNDRVLTLEGERATAYIDHARVGARQGLLPWSRERQVGQLLVEAQRLAREGDDRVARLKVQRALALHPQAPDAVALRESLTGRAVRLPTRSMFDDILEREAERFLAPQGMPAAPNRRGEPEAVKPNPALDLDVTAGVDPSTLAVGAAPFFDLPRLLGGRTLAAGRTIDANAPTQPGAGNETQVASEIAPANASSGLDALRGLIEGNEDLFTTVPTDPGELNGGP